MNSCQESEMCVYICLMQVTSILGSGRGTSSVAIVYGCMFAIDNVLCIL